MREKKWKVFENDLENNPQYAKHAIFVTEPSQIFLSVFRDWKVYPQESREVSHENLCVSLAIGPSTSEQVAILSREKHKNPNFEKIF